jgi:hypothetical protein
LSSCNSCLLSACNSCLLNSCNSCLLSSCNFCLNTPPQTQWWITYIEGWSWTSKNWEKKIRILWPKLECQLLWPKVRLRRLWPVSTIMAGTWTSATFGHMGRTYASLGILFFKKNEVMQICDTRDATLISAYAIVEEIENYTGTIWNKFWR